MIETALMNKSVSDFFLIICNCILKMISGSTFSFSTGFICVGVCHES